MLRYLRERILFGSEAKEENFEEYFSPSEVSIHGFPQGATCMAVDSRLGLLALGSKNRRLQIVGDVNKMWSTTLGEGGPTIAELHFLSGAGTIVVLCREEDRRRMKTPQLYSCRINGAKLDIAQLEVRLSQGKITCCGVQNEKCGEASTCLLLGTDLGEIYARNAMNSELIEKVFSFGELSGTEELDRCERLDKLLVHPATKTMLFLLFGEAKLILIYEASHRQVLRRIHSTETINSLCVWDGKLLCASNNGSYSIWDVRDDKVAESGAEVEVPSSVYPFGSEVKCTPLQKLLRSRCGTEELLIFSGGLPEAEYAERYTVTCDRKSRRLTLDFESPVIDFCLFSEDVDRLDSTSTTLFVLCEQELVAIDLMHANWLPLRLPHFMSFHYSAITSTEVVTCTGKLIEQLREIQLCIEREENSEFSARSWPLRGGSNVSAMDQVMESSWRQHAAESSLLFTGHENGAVHVWKVGSSRAPSLQPWFTCHSVNCFEEARRTTEDENIEKANDLYQMQEVPACIEIRKTGMFDPYCEEDDRLAITKISFHQETGQLTIGGKGGQVLVLEVSSESTRTPPLHKRVINVDLLDLSTVANRAGINLGTPAHVPRCRNQGRTNRLALLPRSTSWTTAIGGFHLAYGTYVQLKPIAPISAVSFNPPTNLLVVGNEYGYCVCDMLSREVLMKKNLTTACEIIHLSENTSALSRFKSVHRTIRQSFRRKKQGAENLKMVSQQRGNFPCIANEPQKVDVANLRPVEREITIRPAQANVLGGETPLSLVRAVKFSQSNLFVGTQGGTRRFIRIILVMARGQDKERCVLVRELRLHHRAPVVDIAHMPQLGRLLIFTEEQIRCFLLPTLASSKFKSRFTAVEGSRIKKAGILQLKSREGAIPRNFISLITNRGEVVLMSLFTPKYYAITPFTQVADAVGVGSAVLSKHGDLFFLKPNGSELQRFTICEMGNARVRLVK